MDALRLNLADIPGEGRFRLAGNLPYNISTPLLFHLFSQREYIVDMHFMLQREVVDRLVAGPGSKAYGRLSIMAAVFSECTRLFDIGPGAFRPPPKVDSSIVRIVPWREPPFPVPDAGRLALIVRQAFSARRKTLRNGLKGLVTPEAIEAAGIDPGARPETLSPAEFAKLAE
jgi:16S rRNA (adenine1518-N6/adenine1519-N6)-dimethyltransferase